MAVYKVPQDVEADDKLLGPFSFKQFIFLVLMFGMGWLTILAWRVSPLLITIPLPFTLIFGILAFPLKKDQPIDVYVAALINFWLRPKERLWDQEGIAEHVIVTAPKKADLPQTERLTSSEVKSRLSRLAQTMDTRGWAIKHADGSPEVDSDRLVAPVIAVSALEEIDTSDVEDVLDTENSAVAMAFARLEQKPVATQPAAEQPVVSPQPGSVVAPPASQPAAQASSAQATSVPVQPPPAPVEADVNLSAGPQADFDPYPEMHQRVIKPETEQGVSEMTKTATPDILDSDNPLKGDGPAATKDAKPDPSKTHNLDEGGEISLR